MGKNDFKISLLNRNIEILEHAKSIMLNGGDDLQSSNSSIQNYFSSISYSKWKGQRRDEFDQKFGEFNDETNTLYSFNNENIEIVENKIQELESQIKSLRSDNDD